MRKQIRQISKFAACVMAGVLGIFCTTPTFAQADEPLAQKTDVWSLDYRVSVKGNFEKEPELGSGNPTVYYHINRVYEGKSKLVFAPNAADPLSASKHPTFKDPAAQVHITIDDFWNTIYEPVCGAFDTIEETWKGDVFSWVSGDPKFKAPALLLINNDLNNYKTSFPLLYSPNNNKRNEIEYLKLKYSNPGRKQQSTERRSVTIQLYQIPKVAGFLENHSITHTTWWAGLKKNEGGSYSWISDILHPDEPLIPEVPDSKDKVNIIIYYSFKRINS